MRYEYQNVIAEYDPAWYAWTITDTAHANVQAWTQEPELAYHTTVAFAADGPDAETEDGSDAD
jgi:hypothetical protein